MATKAKKAEPMATKPPKFIHKGKERLELSDSQVRALLDEGIVNEKDDLYVVVDDWTFADCQQYLTERNIT